MAKLIPILVVIIAAVALFLSVSSRGSKTSGNEQVALTNSPSLPSQDGAAGGEINNGIVGTAQEGDMNLDDDEMAFDDRPATEVFKSADEAYKALLDGSKTYDDFLLEQFTNLPESCTWCNELYAKIKEPLLNPATSADERSYFAEVLAVSGRLDNVKTLVDALNSSTDQDTKDIFAEAIELTSGGPDVVQYLGENLDTKDETLRDATVAALTNQGSRQAVELLYNHTTKENSEDGYYSLGIGVGEIVPEEEAYPLLQEKFLKRDKYSHLAAKALLNAGVDGIRLLSDMINSGGNEEFDKKVLDDSIDHVAFDDETIDYVRNQAGQTRNVQLKGWYEKILKEYDDTAADEEDYDDTEEEELFTPAKP